MIDLSILDLNLGAQRLGGLNSTSNFSLSSNGGHENIDHGGGDHAGGDHAGGDHAGGGGHHAYPVKSVFVISMSLTLGALIRQIQRISFFIMVPTLSLFVIGFIVGYILTHDSITITHEWKDAMEGEMYSYVAVAMPLFIFDATFSFNLYHLKKMWPHVILVIIPSFIITFYGFVYFGHYFESTDELKWQHRLMIVTSITQQSYRMSKTFLSEHIVRPEVTVIVQLEQVFGIMFGILLFDFGLSMLHPDRVAGEYLWEICSSFVVSIVLGYLVANLAYKWTSSIQNDHANSTTIIVTFVYALALVSARAHIPVVASIGSFGLSLAVRRNTMQSALLQVLDKFVEVLVLTLTWTISFLSGIKFYNLAIVNAHLIFNDYFEAVMLFCFNIVARSFVLLMSRMLPPKIQYLESKLSCVIMMFSNFRGTLGFMFAILCLDIFHMDPRLKQKLAMTMIINIIFSMVFNQHLSSIMAIIQSKYSDLREKAIQVTRAIRVLVELKNSSFASLRNNAYIADADWDKVYRYTLIKKDLKREYINLKWLKNAEKVNVDIDKENQFYREEVVRQIGKCTKELFRQCYQHRVINKTALVYLFSSADKIVNTSSTLKTSDIIKTTTINPKLLWLHNCLVKSFALESNEPRRVLRYAFIGIVDIFFILLSLRCHIFDYTAPWDSIYLVHQASVLIFFSLLLIYELIAIEGSLNITKFHVRTYLTILILIAGIIDLLVLINFVPEERRGTGSRINFILIAVFSLTRFVRLVKILEVSHVLKDKIMFYVMGKIEKQVFTAFDIVNAFNIANKYSRKKLSAMIKDPMMEMSIRYALHMQILELKQYLGVLKLKNLGVDAAYSTINGVRLTLTSMLQKLDEIESSGMIGGIDADTIRSSIASRIQSIKKMPTSIIPVATEDVVKSIPWVNNDKELAHFILTRGRVLIYSPKDVIICQGHMPQGLFIILFGLVRIEQQLKRDLRRKSNISITKEVVYHCKDSHQDILVDFVSRGAVLGETSILTGRPGHKTFRCATHVEVLVVKYDEMVRKIGLSRRNTAMSSVERRMWYSVAIRWAFYIMRRDTNHHGLVGQKFRTLLCNTSLIDGYTNKITTIDWNETTAVVLVRGFAMNYFTNAVYVGPCLIPDYCPRLMCQPEKGMRALLLIVKKSAYDESNVEFSHLENIYTAGEEFNGTVSSGSSYAGPTLNIKPFYEKVPNTEVKLNWSGTASKQASQTGTASNTPSNRSRATTPRESKV